MALRPRVLRTATFRLAALYLVFFALSVGVLALLFHFSVRSALESEVRAQVTAESNLLLFEYREDGLDELLEEIEERIDKAAPGQRLQYMVQNPQGKVIFEDIPLQPRAGGWRHVEGDVPRLYFFTPLENGYLFGVGKELANLQATQRVLAHIVGWILAVALVIGLLGGLVLSRRTLAQLRGINQAAREVGRGRLSQRIPERGSGDELDELGQNLNGMLDRIEQLMSSVRHVSTGIAHDLRTPLARLRNHLEALCAGSVDAREQAGLQQALAETDTILQTFQAMLRLAEVESGTLKEHLKPLDFSALSQRLVEAYRPLVEEAGGRLTAEIEPGLSLHGDAGLLQQMLANLLGNTLQHAGPAPEVLLKSRLCPDGLVLEVSDRGPGIAAEQRDRALRPFERLGNSAGSAGFGLALAAAIARLHDAELQLLDNSPGLLCRVRFITGPPRA